MGSKVANFVYRGCTAIKDYKTWALFVTLVYGSIACTNKNSQMNKQGKDNQGSLQPSSQAEEHLGEDAETPSSQSKDRSSEKSKKKEQNKKGAAQYPSFPLPPKEFSNDQKPSSAHLKKTSDTLSIPDSETVEQPLVKASDRLKLTNQPSSHLYSQEVFRGNYNFRTNNNILPSQENNNTHQKLTLSQSSMSFPKIEVNYAKKNSEKGKSPLELYINRVSNIEEDKSDQDETSLTIINYDE